MRFFTRAWCTGELSDDECEQVVSAYWRHVAEIAPRLPADARLLAEQLSLHDGLFRRLIVNQTAQTCRMELRCGDLQVGYFDLDIEYRDASFMALDVDNAATIVDGEHSEILYDEVDIIGNGRFVHRLLCWPQGELWIAFADLAVVRRLAGSRAFEVPNPRHADVSVPPGVE
jgi:hypothetical protein